MTPQEKAEELVGKCFDTFINDEDEFHDKAAWRLSKQCALITVDELIKTHKEMQDFLFSEIGYLITSPEYWQEVKQEIEKL